LTVVVNDVAVSVTSWENAGELVLVAYPASPLYTAVMAWVPNGSALVVQVACSVLPVGMTDWALHPLIPVPSDEKATVPPPSFADTVAVNVTGSPKADGVPEEPTTVVVGVISTVRSTVLEAEEST
jgi:hypothetical protein